MSVNSVHNFYQTLGKVENKFKMNFQQFLVKLLSEFLLSQNPLFEIIAATAGILKKEITKMM